MPRLRGKSPVRVRPRPEVERELHHRRGVVMAPIVDTLNGLHGVLVQLEGRTHPVVMPADYLVEDDDDASSGRRPRQLLFVVLIVVLALLAGTYSGNAQLTSTLKLDRFFT